MSNVLIVGMSFLAGVLTAVLIECVYDIHQSRPRILKPRDETPFTSDELRRIGIILPDPTRYDCETFVR